MFLYLPPKMTQYPPDVWPTSCHCYVGNVACAYTPKVTVESDRVKNFLIIRENSDT